jgi:cyanophycinase
VSEVRSNGRPATPGFVVPIGGAEQKRRRRIVLERFAELAGGASAHIVVIPTASEASGAGERYRRIFKALKVGEVTVMPIADRATANETRCCDALDDATAVFITGGNQLRLSTILGGTPVARTLRQRHAEGVHVGGTSAGAAILAEHMIGGGMAGATPRGAGVVLAPGLGFTRRLVIDQHFRQRDRLGRLLAALSYNPQAVGVGIDEDTALFLSPDDSFEVVGSGAVTIVDPVHLTHSSMYSAEPGEPVTVAGMTLHVLTHGGRYDLEHRAATPPTPEHILEAREVRAGGEAGMATQRRAGRRDHAKAAAANARAKER